MLNINNLSAEEARELLDLLSRQQEIQTRKECQQDFMKFVREMWPNFVDGEHHKIMAEAFNDVASGKLKRLIINMPPRHTKSEFASYFLPAFYLGRHPEKKIIMCSHTSELATGFGRKVRNLVDGDKYQKVFSTKLQSDSKAAGRWSTNEGGEYFAIGIGGAVTGKGADLLIIDDPHSEQDAMSGQYSGDVYDRAWDWYVTGPRQRLQPGAAIIMVATRWSKIDLTGRMLEQAAKNNELSKWRVIQFPALLPSGEPLWPAFWSKEELQKVRDDIPNGRWMAQYQQTPTAEEGAIIKREWWQPWKSSRAPECMSIISSWDTAFSKKSSADYTACTTWGVFDHPETGIQSLILLDAFRDRYEFPELKRVAKEHWQEWKPDMMLVEGRAAGKPLIYELRAMGIPVQEFMTAAGSDKLIRANSVADFFASKLVYAPETNWARDVIEECAEFPNGKHDDYMDTVSQALLRIRKGGFINPVHDAFDEEPRRRVHQGGYY
jgi:predicted phage terminase large subunit-like protein